MKPKSPFTAILTASLALTWLGGMAGCYRHDHDHDDHVVVRPVVVEERRPVVVEQAPPIIVHDEVREVHPQEHADIHVDVRP